VRFSRSGRGPLPARRARPSPSTRIKGRSRARSADEGLPGAAARAAAAGASRGASSRSSTTSTFAVHGKGGACRGPEAPLPLWVEPSCSWGIQ